jgi:hypothetical protein
MPFEHVIEAERARATVTGVGAVSMASMIAAIERLAADSEFQSSFTVIFDLRKTQYEADLADGDALAAVLRQRRGRFANRFAVVVPESLLFVARLYCLLADMAGFDHIRCFIDMEEAHAWCDAGK